MGALTQAPRHSTSSIVNRPFLVVWLKSMPNLSRQALTTASLPRSQQGVVVQICNRYLPTGCCLNIV